jgi:hypothetical protein
MASMFPRSIGKQQIPAVERSDIDHFEMLA